MIAFLIDKISPRWEYTFDFIFRQRGIEFKLFDDFTTFDESKGLKHQLPCSFGRLLNETGLFNGIISNGDWEDQTIVAFDDHPDLLSSIFYVLTRMEEYQSSKLDEHGRFEGRQSWQYRNGFLNQAICDRWAVAFINHLEKETKEKLPFVVTKAELIPTFDIDNVFAYQYKTGKRKFLSKAKDLVQGNKTRRNERTSVLEGKTKDPYNSYGQIQQIAKNFPVHIFWLVGDYGQMDYNISIEKPEITQLVQKLKETCSLGIHPSYRSNEDANLLAKEIMRLESTVDSKISISRQHFLKLRFPETFQGLINSGIQEDYTMGFADQIGFRNGTARSFPWFDLSKDETTNLMIRPFVYMDGTLNEYLKFSPKEANVKIRELYNEVETFGGDFIFLWHNETITNYGIWKGWSTVLDFTLSLNKK